MKKIITVLLTAAMLLSLTGCASTPDSPIVVQKDNERLESAAAETSAEGRKPLSELKETAGADTAGADAQRYSFNYESKDGRVKISADADVILPDADKIPMYHLKAATFSDAEAKAIFDYLFHGKEPYRISGYPLTKSDADQILLEQKEELAKLEGDPTYIQDADLRAERIEMVKELIAGYEEIYDELPEQLDRESADGIYAQSPNQKNLSTVEAVTDDGSKLHITKFTDKVRGNVEYTTPSGERFRNWYQTLNDIYRCSAAEAEELCACSYSYEEALNLAAGLPAAAGIDVRLAQSGLIKGSDIQPGIGLSTDTDYSGYAFFFSRLIDGTPVAVTTCNEIYHEDTAPVWLYEKIMIVVNDDGIAWVDWSAPVELIDSVANDVSVLPFEKAAASFEQMKPLIAQGNNAEWDEDSEIKHSLEISVDHIELDLIRVRDSGELTGLYTPAWVFYGTETRSFHEEGRADHSFTEQIPWIVFAVNAVDGSIIDIIAGY